MRGRCPVSWLRNLDRRSVILLTRHSSYFDASHSFQSSRTTLKTMSDPEILDNSPVHTSFRTRGEVADRDCNATGAASGANTRSKLELTPGAEKRHEQHQCSVMHGHSTTMTNPCISLPRSTKDYLPGSPTKSQEELNVQDLQGYDTERIPTPEMDELIEKYWRKTRKQTETGSSKTLQQGSERVGKRANPKRSKRMRTCPRRAQDVCN